MKKGTEADVTKKRARKTTKFQRSIQGATLENILAKRNQKPEVSIGNNLTFSQARTSSGCWLFTSFVDYLTFCQIIFNYPSLSGDRNF